MSRSRHQCEDPRQVLDDTDDLGKMFEIEDFWCFRIKGRNECIRRFMAETKTLL